MSYFDNETFHPKRGLPVYVDLTNDDSIDVIDIIDVDNENISPSFTSKPSQHPTKLITSKIEPNATQTPLSSNNCFEKKHLTKQTSLNPPQPQHHYFNFDFISLTHQSPKQTRAFNESKCIGSPVHSIPVKEELLIEEHNLTEQIKQEIEKKAPFETLRKLAYKREEIRKEIGESEKASSQTLNDLELTCNDLMGRVELWEYENEKCKFEKFKEGDVLPEPIKCQKQNVPAMGCNWWGENFSWNKRVNETLNKQFKLNSLRPFQYPIINCIMAGHDVMATMPTGGGKSLCYQLPAILSGGYTFIISPLISLMTDQIEKIKKIGNIEKRYLDIIETRRQFPNIQTLLFTATATEKVKNDVLFHMGMDKVVVFKQTFDRSNLIYKVENKNERNIVVDIAKYVFSRKNDSGIIFCLSRKDCERVSSGLNKMGIKADYYHASRKQTERDSVQKKWMEDKIKVVVATVAFGMGIDKSDVRFVIHLTLPASIEQYMQESGRVGRDGLPGECVIFYSEYDKNRVFNLKSKNCKNTKSVSDRINFMGEYCVSKECRRQLMLKHFGEILRDGTCGECDNCKNRLRVVE
ncbi:ATP-dependent DNA helicase [Entamoeba marina]